MYCHTVTTIIIIIITIIITITINSSIKPLTHIKPINLHTKKLSYR